MVPGLGPWRWSWRVLVSGNWTRRNRDGSSVPVFCHPAMGFARGAGNWVLTLASAIAFEPVQIGKRQFTGARRTDADVSLSTVPAIP